MTSNVRVIRPTGCSKVLVPAAAFADVVPLPHLGELLALEQELAHDGGQARGVDVRAGDGAQVGHRAGDGVVPRRDELLPDRVEEEVAGHVAVLARPLPHAGVHPAAGEPASYPPLPAPRYAEVCRLGCDGTRVDSDAGGRWPGRARCRPHVQNSRGTR